MALVDIPRLPRHIAIIMDGNGRWAQLMGQPRTEGHKRGSRAVRRVVEACRRLGISALTLYAFSEQNWARPQEETQALMELLHEFLLTEQESILSNGICLRAIGRTHRLPTWVRQVLDPLVKETSAQQSMTLSLALSYGGREEIVDAARTLAKRVEVGHLEAQAIDECLLQQAMPSLAVGPVDLLIRTGGEQRISNFLLWSAAYAEFHFSNKLWPDYDAPDLYDAIAAFQARERRFGRVPVDNPAQTHTSRQASRRLHA
ncbi:MAG: polyprenyl diphosphate synthase [Polyangiales bacterium]